MHFDFGRIQEAGWATAEPVLLCHEDMYCHTSPAATATIMLIYDRLHFTPPQPTVLL